jgi:hypothetical protein
MNAPSQGQNAESHPLLQTQIVHNVVIKELTRQVSVHCIERGIILKTVFDCYVRLLDIVYGENFKRERD